MRQKGVVRVLCPTSGCGRLLDVAEAWAVPDAIGVEHDVVFVPDRRRRTPIEKATAMGDAVARWEGGEDMPWLPRWEATCRCKDKDGRRREYHLTRSKFDGMILAAVAQGASRVHP